MDTGRSMSTHVKHGYVIRIPTVFDGDEDLNIKKISMHSMRAWSSQ